MKRLNYLVNGLAALALIVLFSQCAGKADNQTTNASAQAAGLSGMKIAYVEIDTLLAKYNYCVDLNEAMVKKSENCTFDFEPESKGPRPSETGIPDKSSEQCLSDAGTRPAGV